MKRISEKIKSELVALKKKGIPIVDICKKLGISDSSVTKHSKGIQHPNKKILMPLPKSAKHFSVEKAEILGYLCSEGNDNDQNKIYPIFDKKRGKAYNCHVKKNWINFSNMDKTLQERFVYLMKSVYNYPLKFYRKGSFYIQRKAVVEDLRKYTLFGARRWRVPGILFERKYKNHALRFIRAYLDGDGTVTNYSVRADSVNPNSLKVLSSLLFKLGFINIYNSYPSRNRITIKDIKSYKKFIGFLEPYKKERLEKINARSCVGQKNTPFI